MVGLFGCTPNNQGNLEATNRGDTSFDQAVVGDADAELLRACGEPLASSAARNITRDPYLQRVTPSSASVMWAAKGGRGSGLQITTPGGDVVKTVTAKLDLPDEGGASDRLIARVSGLRAGTVYCYSIVDDARRDVLGRIGFRTAPGDGSDGPVSFAVLGDSGDATADQYALTEQIGNYPLDFMVHLGDMAYGSGTYAEFDQKYFDVYEDLIRSFAVFPIPGNHEYRSEDAGPYRALFDLPNNERYYSFDWGQIHFSALDTEQLGDEQDRWLEHDLASTDRPWKIVFLHKGPYSSGWHGSNEEVQDRFTPLFEKYGVTLVFSGHDHHYERTRSMNGVHYIVSGGGGAGTYPVQESEFTAFAEEVIEFVYVTLEDDTLAVHAIDGTGVEFDQLVLER